MSGPYNAVMHADVAERLLDINREFYQSHAADFTESRPRLQPGVQRILQRIGRQESVFDAGCGFGGVAAALQAAGHRGRYLGVDSSHALIERARTHEDPPRVRFEQADLTEMRLSRAEGEAFDWILAFAVLHHLPGVDMRRRVVQGLASCLLPGGHVAVSVWTFLNSPRLRRRILPWSTVGLAADDVDPGDVLLDWRRGEVGLRYVHAFTSVELEQLAGEAGLRRSEAFASDGEAGRLGLYQVWEREESPRDFDAPTPAW